ncbi:MAG TPA: hypothetical protein VEN30_10780 [Paraburkholderia sp.]|nr:hypothetical protein [Paraburkholderia sp.]
MTTQFSLDRLESLVQSRDYDAATPYGNTDHIVRALLEHAPAPDDKDAGNALTKKQLVLYTMESQYEIDLGALASTSAARKCLNI